MAFMVLISACKEDFLEIAPTGSLGSAELSTFAGVDGALTATYSILLGRGGFYTDASNWFWGSVLGGEANKGTNEGDQSQVNEIQAYNAQTNNASVFEKYSRTYEGVARANATLKLLGESTTIGAEDATRLGAEARFLRGHYYFELKKIFNNTPYVDETWDEITPVGNTADLWPFIEADLKFAYDNLPETQSDAGRANKWAAGAYYAKALLFQGKYADANSILRAVMDDGVTANGQPYGLNANYGDAFYASNDNSMESVFASQAAAGTGTINNANPGLVLNFPHGGGDRPGGCCGFNQPSIELANSYRTNPAGLPMLDGSYNDADKALIHDMGIESGKWNPASIYSTGSYASIQDAADASQELVYRSLTDENEGNDPASSSDWELVWSESDQSVDPRLDHAIGRRGVPYLDWGAHPGKLWIRDQPYGGPYSPKKFIYYKDVAGDNDGSSWTPGYTAVNYNLIRYADVILWAAECEIEQGNLDEGRALINMVRNRAKTSMIMEEGAMAANYVIEPYDSFSDQEEARAALRMERKLELSGEGHRMYDLVRWGVAASELNNYLSVDSDVLINSSLDGTSFQSSKNEYLPIPQNEIDLLGADVLKQNPGY